MSYHFVVAMWRTKAAEFAAVKYWEIIVNKMIKAGFSVGWVSAVDSRGRSRHWICCYSSATVQRLKKSAKIGIMPFKGGRTAQKWLAQN